MVSLPHEVLGIPASKVEAERFAFTVIHEAQEHRAYELQQATESEEKVSAEVMTAVALQMIAIEGM